MWGSNELLRVPAKAESLKQREKHPCPPAFTFSAPISMSSPYRGISASHSRSSIASSSRSPAQSPAKTLRDLEFSESFVEPSTNNRPTLGRANRSSTLSSFTGFDFRDGLLPLAPSGDQVGSRNDTNGGLHAEEKHVGLIHGVALVVGMQVGSGIFSSPGVVVAEVGSTGASLAVWVISGILAWTGAR